ncbi:conserved Plasmodium protein, unknown function [Plasmodium malariae]|uniref:Uncharacterized protein n=1 Tax=Plasmodium malariae TaxID=5858 RepID=A0A1C3KM27_PLAMA|nr:conserved Plasmodium protein, unknown function [Plasmodium malariae]
MVIHNIEDMDVVEISYSDYSYNSDTTASSDTSDNDENGIKIQIKIRRAIENRILYETNKKKKRKLLNFEKNFKKRKSMKIEGVGYKIISRKLKLFKNNDLKENAENMVNSANNKDTNHAENFSTSRSHMK